MNASGRLRSQTLTPLLSALAACASQGNVPFHTPGHKRGKGTPQPLLELLGLSALQADLPELPELDNLFAPQAAIREAQELAAEAFGAEQTWFLANGSTCGIEAAVLATCKPGDKLILPRNAHRSAIAALILAGAVPVFVEPEYDAHWDIAHSITAEGVAAALTQHPDAKAVMMVSPTYYGVCGDVRAIAQLAHQHQIPLIVDEAHGPHFAFHSSLPASALANGADVVVQSTHKVLAALTQAAMLHRQGSYISVSRLNQALQLVQSTSPSYLLLASLDATRQQMSNQGTTLLSQTVALSELARKQLSQIPELSVLQPTAAGSAGFFALDPTRLTVDVTGCGMTGFEADEILHHSLGVTAELPSLRNLTFIISIGNTAADISMLVAAFQALVTQRKKQVEPFMGDRSINLPQQLPMPPALLSPREAFFAPTVTVSVEAAIDRISAELICPYPPGIPIIFPGEAVTHNAIAYLKQVIAAGGLITGCTDPDLQTLQVVAE